MKLLEQLRSQIKAKLDERSAKQTELDELVAGAEARGEDLNADETAKFAEARSAIVAIDEARTALEARVAELEDDEQRRQAAEASAKQFAGDEDRTSTPGNIRVGQEERTYRPDGGASFFADAYRATKMGDFGAQDRLRRHGQESLAEQRGTESRAVTTSAFGGLVVPQYLVEEFAAVLRNGRPLANAVRRAPLPAEGMTLVIPRGETGAAAAAQATQNTEVQNTDVDFDNDLSVPVRTYAGEQDVSRQSLERGTPGVDRLLYADLVADYATKIDVAIIAADGNSGTHKGLLSASGTNAVTYTDGTPTVVEAWPKLADAKRQVGKNRKMAANLIVMTSTRWAWFVSALDGQNRPLIVDDPSAAVNAMGASVAANFGEGQLAGILQGLPVLIDDNIPEILGAGTNEDRILVIRRQDPILWEENDGMPRELRFEETNGGKLQTKLVVYGYSAFTAERYPVAVSKISGTGLVAPTF